MNTPTPAPVTAPAITSLGQWWAMPIRAALIAAAEGTSAGPSAGQAQVAADANANAFAACVDGKDDDVGAAIDPRESRDVRRVGRSRSTTF